MQSDDDDEHDHSRSGHGRNILHPKATIKALWDSVWTVLKWPVIIGLIGADAVIVLPLWTFLMIEHQWLYAFVFLFCTQAPIIYYVVKRIQHENSESTIMKEGWEGPSLENLGKAVEEYKKLLEQEE